MKPISTAVRKGLFFLDIAVVSYAIVFALHYWQMSYNVWWLRFVFVIYTLLLRLNISVMLYRRQRAIMTTMLFMLIGCSTIFYGTWLSYASWKMIKIPLLLYTSAFGQLDRAQIDGIAQGNCRVAWWVMFLWCWLLPAVILIYRAIVDLCERLFGKKAILPEVGAKKIFMPDWSLNRLRKDKAGKLTSLVLVATLLAWLAGREQSLLPSLIITILLPCLTYTFAGKVFGRESKTLYIILVLAGGVLFWVAQYYVGTTRVILLIASVLLMAIAVVRMIFTTKRYLSSIVLLLFIAFFLPAVSIGYNQYTAIKGSRLGLSAEAGNCKTGVIIVQTDSCCGIRDRYGMIVPAEYDSITPINIGPKKYAVANKDNTANLIDLNRRDVKIILLEDNQNPTTLINGVIAED